MAALDVEFLTSLETNLIRVACTLEAKTTTSNSIKREQFIADDNNTGF